VNSNRSGQAWALTVLTPIAPGRDQELRSYLESLGTAGGQSPLARVPRTHFARWVIVPDFVNDAAQPAQDSLGCQYLLFTANVDGPLDSYLDGLCSQIAEEATRIWGCCIGYPQPDTGTQLKAYLQHNQIDTGFFFSAYPDASVAEVLHSLDVRERMIAFAASAQHLPALSVRDAFVKEFAP